MLRAITPNRVEAFGKNLWNRYFQGNNGRIITQWAFSGRAPHARQVALNRVGKNGERIQSIVTCFQGAKEGELPLIKETLTFLPNGEKRAAIFGIYGNKTFYAAGKPGDKSIYDACKKAYHGNPDAKSYLFRY